MFEALEAINNRIDKVRLEQAKAKEEKNKKAERVLLIEEISLLKSRLSILENLEYKRITSNNTI